MYNQGRLIFARCFEQCKNGLDRNGAFVKRIKSKYSFKLLILFILLIGGLLSSVGLMWGKVESWNPDEMAFRPLYNGRPYGYQKPPFHTYFIYFLVLKPLSFLKNYVTLTYQNEKLIMFLWARLLNVGLFIASGCILYKLVEEKGKKGPIIITGLYITSAGMIAYTHFLTADIPVTFWMLASFLLGYLFYKRNRVRYLILAGVIAGVATATKYNGLFITVPLLAFCLFQSRNKFKMFIIYSTILGLTLLIGFVLANPFSILDHTKFFNDFYYNLKTDTLYRGSSGRGYLDFLYEITQIIGIPASLLFLGSCGYYLFSKAEKGIRNFPPLILASVFMIVVYWLFFGRVSDVYTRFVLPVIPYIFIVLNEILSPVYKKTRFLYVFIGGILIYNVIASYYVGKRFDNDTRVLAQK